MLPLITPARHSVQNDTKIGNRNHDVTKRHYFPKDVVLIIEIIRVKALLAMLGRHDNEKSQFKNYQNQQRSGSLAGLTFLSELRLASAVDESGRMLLGSNDASRAR